MGIGARIRAERKAQKLSPQALADAAGLAYSTLMDLERGESKSTTRLHQIASALGVSVFWLETGRGPKRPESFSASTESSPTGHGTVTSASQRLLPDPATLSAAYQMTLFGIGLYGGPALRLSLPEDAAIVCDVYGLIAAGGGSLPGGQESPELAAIIKRRGGSEGEKHDRAAAEPARRGNHRNR